MWPLIVLTMGISVSGVIAPGPMLTVVLAKSYKTPWAGTYMSLGHAVIEVPLIVLIYFGFARFFENHTVQLILAILGGSMILWMSIDMFRSRRKIVQEGKDLPYSAFTAGITMSALNPFFLLWWATAGSLLVMKFLDFGVQGLFVVIIAHWVCDLIWLSAISQIFHRTHHFLPPRFQEGLFIIMALFLAGFGLYYVVSGVNLI